MMCQHCQEKPATRARSLCAACYSRTSIRDLYRAMTPAESGLHARVVNGCKPQKTGKYVLHHGDDHYAHLAAQAEAGRPLTPHKVPGFRARLPQGQEWRYSEPALAEVLAQEEET